MGKRRRQISNDFTSLLLLESPPEPFSSLTTLDDPLSGPSSTPQKKPRHQKPGFKRRRKSISFKSTSQELSNPFDHLTITGIPTFNLSSEPEVPDQYIQDDIFGLPTPQDTYDEFVNGVLTKAIPFHRLTSNIYIVPGWDAKSSILKVCINT